MWDGRSEAILCPEIWIIKHKQTDETVFEYRTYQGNKKKAVFNSPRYAKEALDKYIKNPDDYYVVQVGDAGGYKRALWQMRDRIQHRCLEGGIYPAFVKNVVDQVVKEMMG